METAWFPTFITASGSQQNHRGLLSWFSGRRYIHVHVYICSFPRAIPAIQCCVLKCQHATLRVWATVCTSMMMDVATNIVVARPTLSSISKQQ